MPGALLVSCLLLVTEWFISFDYPAVAAVAVYLHVAAFGSVLISGFWSTINERFDPHSAKRAMSRIATGAAIGGLVGGLLSERFAVGLSVSAMLPMLAGIQVLSSIGIYFFSAGTPGAQFLRSTPSEAEKGIFDGLQKVTRQPYLRSLALLILMGAAGAALIDFVFKAEASNAFSDGEELLRFFAFYYTAVGFLGVAVQSLVSRFALVKLGVGRSASLLPAALGAGALASFLVPGLGSVTIGRGSEGVVRNSLFRSAYELLYTPVPKNEKRASKPIIDVGADRLGDMVGGGFVQLLHMVGVVAVRDVLLSAAFGVAFLGLYVALRLQKGYVRALERSLKVQGAELDLSHIEDAATKQSVILTIAAWDSTVLQAPGAKTEEVDTAGKPVPVASPGTTEPVVHDLMSLRSGNLDEVNRVLKKGKLDPLLVPSVIQLLAWDEVAPTAIGALRRNVPTIEGQLTDALVDPAQDFSVRRRVPRVLSASSTQSAAESLFRGMDDARFEVRFQSTLALASLSQRESLQFDGERVMELVLREVSVEEGLWKSNRLLDHFDVGTSKAELIVDGYLKDRSSRSLEHVFNVLSLILPKEPLKIAFRGLHTDNVNLRGTALEYLESVLPEEIRLKLWTLLDEGVKGSEMNKSKEEVLDQLLHSNASIVLELERIREAAEGEGTSD
jgi:hypothetical protein